MCGAKLHPEDDNVCTECDASISNVAPVPSLDVGTTAVESPPAPSPSDWNAEEFTDPDVELPTPKRRTGLIVGLVAVAAAGVGGAIAWSKQSASAATPPDEAPPAVASDEPDEDDARPDTVAAAPPNDCANAQALAGSWSFITEVTGSRVVQSSGLNGFYTVEFTVDGCDISAALTKTGYTARNFSEQRIQHATAKLSAGKGVQAGFWSGEFEMQSGAGAHGITEFSFTTHNDRLAGVYRQRGARWLDTGLSGFLEGSHDGEYDRDPSSSTQPCAVRCHLACDGAQREEVQVSAMQSCVDACEADANASATCGDAKPLPDSMKLAIAGPAPLKKLCKVAGGCAKKLGRGHGKGPSLKADRLAEGWIEIKMVRGKKEGAPRLAFHGPAGWYLSAPLFNASKRAKLGLLRLYARQLGDGQSRRNVLGLARSKQDQETETFFACRLDDKGPSCVYVSKGRGVYASALPEGVLTLGPREGGAPWGVFSW